MHKKLAQNPVSPPKKPFWGAKKTFLLGKKKSNLLFAHVGEKKIARRRTNRKQNPSRANRHDNKGIPAMGLHSGNSPSLSFCHGGEGRCSRGASHATAPAFSAGDRNVWRCDKPRRRDDAASGGRRLVCHRTTAVKATPTPGTPCSCRTANAHACNRHLPQRLERSARRVALSAHAGRSKRRATPVTVMREVPKNHDAQARAIPVHARNTRARARANATSGQV